MSKSRHYPDIPDNGPFSRAQLQSKLTCDERHAQRLIREWLGEGLIEISHKLGKVIFYQKIFNSFISYQSNFLDNYIPNKKTFFSKDELSELEKYGIFNDKIDLETYHFKIYQRLMIDLSWASSKLEGNTYSLLETEKLLNGEDPLLNKSPQETQMILNHKEAIKFLTMNAKSAELNLRCFQSIHALLAENLMTNLSAVGALRKIPVGISGTSYTPINFPQLLEDEFNVFIEKLKQIKNPFEKSFFVLVFLPYIQPFEDMNKRTSRMACNIPLLKNNLVPISFKNIETPEYIEALKDVYEKNNPAKMKKIYIKSLIFSSHDYQHIVTTLATPSMAIVSHRKLIKDIIYECVAEKLKFTMNMLAGIPQDDREVVYQQIVQELKNLHEGQLVRFNLLPSQFESWKKSN
jgi:Fic family protein